MTIDSDEFDVFDWPKTSLGKRFADLEEVLHCPICDGLLDNPQMLSCGHTYCSLCIRKHLDKVLNSNTSDVCPSCREKADVSMLRPNRLIMDLIQRYKLVRQDTLLCIKYAGSEKPNMPDLDCSAKKSSVPATFLTGQKNRFQGTTGINDEVKRMTQFNCHGQSKANLKKALEKLTESSKIRIRLDGEKPILERRIRELIHFNNAQLGSLNPLSLSEVVKELNKREDAREAEAQKATKTAKMVAEMKSGKIDGVLGDNFSKLIAQAKKRKLEELQQLATSTNDAKAVKEEPSNCHESLHESSCHSARMSHYFKPWRILFSDVLGRPFFYNTLTCVGQFEVPAELLEDSQHQSDEPMAGDAMGSISGGIGKASHEGYSPRSSQASVDALKSHQPPFSPMLSSPLASALANIHDEEIHKTQYHEDIDIFPDSLVEDTEIEDVNYSPAIPSNTFIQTAVTPLSMALGGGCDTLPSTIVDSGAEVESDYLEHTISSDGSIVFIID